MSLYHNNLGYLYDELRRLDLFLERAVAQFRIRRSRDSPAEFRGLYISDEDIDDLMTDDKHKACPYTGEPAEKASVNTEPKLRALRSEIEQRINDSQRAGVLLRLPHLSTVFGLSPFETDVLLLALAPELDLRYQKLYAYLQDDVSRKRPSVDLALRLFCETLDERVKAREVLTESSPLFTSSLLMLCEDSAERPTPLLSRFIKMDDRVVEFLLGSDHLDPRLTATLRMVRWVAPEIDLRDLVIPENVKASLEKIIDSVAAGTPWVCLLHGPTGSGKKASAEVVCQALGRSLLVIDLPLLFRSNISFQTLLRLSFREAWLYRSAIYLDGWDELLKDEPTHLAGMRIVEQEIERFPGLVFLGSRSPWQPTSLFHRKFVNIELQLPNDQSRRKLWEMQLRNGHPLNTEVDPSRLASAFRFTGGQIRHAIVQGESHAHLRQGEGYQLTMEDLLAGCRVESTRHLIAFAKKISPKRLWGDLVLPKDTLMQLREFCQQARYRVTVYGDWGFDQKLSLGKGLLALFAGPSGTGKTLSAEILANELGLDLYKVDLSCVVSKYIGETEKNLSRVFQDAQDSNAILLFDEADALFGKRSEVKDAHDRYANIEINYLLQRVEEYEGVIILASNMSKNIDDAFLRRMHFCIEFPFPNEDYRLRIWQGIFPPQAPLEEDLDFEFLASKFKIAGGNIKNVALAAAFRAAEDEGVIRMDHLVMGMKREYQKLGKVCEKAEFERYYDLVR
jgi:SpoVK/Ycf46/Vps4 family AAA+-type ATPase